MLICLLVTIINFTGQASLTILRWYVFLTLFISKYRVITLTLLELVHTFHCVGSVCTLSVP